MTHIVSGGALNCTHSALVSKVFRGWYPPPRTLAKNAFVAWTRTLVFLFFDHWYASELNLTALPPTQHTFGSFGGVARVTRVGGGRISPIIVAAESDMGPLFCRLNPTQCIKCRVLSRTRKLCATNYCNACLTAWRSRGPVVLMDPVYVQLL